jgi:hypothetical protein
MKVAWQQMQLVVKTPKSEGEAPRRPEIGDSQSSPLRKFDDAANDTVQIEGTNFAATFSRSAGTLTSLVYDGREMLASDKKVAQASRLPNVSSQSGLGDSNCGPGVLERYAVLPMKTHHLHLLLRPYPAPGTWDG